MNRCRNGKIHSKTIALLAIAAVIMVVLAVQWSHVHVVPPPPQDTTATIDFPVTTSHLSLVSSFPRTAIAAQLEAAIPNSFPFDVNSGGARAYGTPSRGPVNVAIDAAAKRVSLSTQVSGKVQVEKRVKVDLLVGKIDQLASVGINISGDIKASVAPVIAPNWTINPQVDLSAHINQAVAKLRVPIIGDVGVDVTGHVQGPVGNAVSGVKANAEAKLKEALDVRKDVERLWNEMNSVHKLTDEPPTWLRITPRQATFGEFHYMNDSIDSGLSLDLETHVFLQDAAPGVLTSPLPDLHIAQNLSDDYELSIPVEVAYDVINRQLKTQLAKNPINLPQGASVTITDVTIGSHGDGILLTVAFSGKKGWFKKASGRLYVAGVPVFDAGKAELRLDKLEFTADTRSLLVKTVDWLAHATLLEAMKNAADVKLDGELAKAKTKANEELDKLKSKLPKEVGANVLVTDVSVDRLAFAKARAFAVVKAKGKMSAKLK